MLIAHLIIGKYPPVQRVQFVFILCLKSHNLPFLLIIILVLLLIIIQDIAAKKFIHGPVGEDATRCLLALGLGADEDAIWHNIKYVK